AEALDLFQKSLRNYEAAGARGRLVGICLYEIAETQSKLKNDAEAERLLRRSLEILQAEPDEDPKEIAIVQDGLSFLLVRSGRASEADALFEQALRNHHRAMMRTLSALSEPEQLEFLRRKHEPVYGGAIARSLFRGGDGNNFSPETQATVVMNCKA